MFYTACKTCKKKVYDIQEGYRCEKCDKVYPDCVPTYNFTVKVCDHTDSVSVQCLGEVGQAFMGMDCTEFHTIHEDPE